MTHNYTFYYSSQEYKDGWERIFGNAKTKDEQAGAVKRTRRSSKGDKGKKAQRSPGGKRRTQNGDNVPAQESGSDSSSTT